jgi:hypothetical protein
MATRTRDYKAEYARRKALAAARGLSVSQARGHPRAQAGEVGVRALKRGGTVATSKETTLGKFYRAVAELARGRPLRQAAMGAGISPSTVRRLNRERRLFQPVYRYNRAGKPTSVKGHEVAYSGSTPILTSDSILIAAPPVDAKTASVLGSYWNAVGAALKGDDRALKAFAHTTIYDATGNDYRLMADPNAIRRWFDRLSDQDEADFWRTLYTGRTVVYAPAA